MDRQAVSTQLAPIIRSTFLVVDAVIPFAFALISLLSRVLSRRILKLRTST